MIGSERRLGGYECGMPWLVLLIALVVVIYLGTRMQRTWRGAGRRR